MSSHFKNEITKERRPPCKRKLFNTSEDETKRNSKEKLGNDSSSSLDDSLICTLLTSPKKEELYMQLKEKDEQLEKQKGKIKVLQQKVRRLSAKVETIQKLFSDLQRKNLLRPNVSVALENLFSRISGRIIMNHFNNKDKSSKGHRHNTEAKKFALNLHFYSYSSYFYFYYV